MLLSIASAMAPISLVMVFWQTSPFWTSIIAWAMLGEQIFVLELVAMVICFSAVVIIAMQAQD